MSIKKKKTIYSNRGNRYSNFPKREILLIVAEVENGLTRKEACIKYGMGYSTICAWMQRYGILQTNTQKVQLTNQKRREMVRAITDGRMTVKQAMLACNITCASSIRKWIREMQAETVDLADNNGLSMPPLPDCQKELAAARLKITALETMIDIAEEQFKISIRKKYGAKQLQK
jgi:transposase-like protein